MGDTLLLGVRVVVSLAIVLVLLWFLARRLGAGATTARRVPVTVLGRQTLGRRAGVTVVEVEGRTLLLGVSDAGVSLLTELYGQPGQIPPPPPPGAEPAGRHDTEPRSDLAPTALDTDGDLRRPGGPLAGSLLAPATWRAAWDATRGRVRA